MTRNKTEVLNFRVSPSTKEGLRLAAERENRSMANMLECLVQEYLRRNGLHQRREEPTIKRR